MLYMISFYNYVYEGKEFINVIFMIYSYSNVILHRMLARRSESIIKVHNEGGTPRNIHLHIIYASDRYLTQSDLDLHCIQGIHFVSSCIP